MLGRRKRAEEEAARIEAARTAHLAELPADVRPLVQEGWGERDAHFSRLSTQQHGRWRQCVIDGAVLFVAVELLLNWLLPVEMLIASVVRAGIAGALVGALWIPLVGNRFLGLQLAAPLTVMPAFLILHFTTGSGSTILDLRHLLGAFILGLLSAWIGFSRDEELHGA